MFCPKCGTQITMPNAKFCSKCGVAFVANQQQKPISQKPIPQQRPVQKQIQSNVAKAGSTIRQVASNKEVRKTAGSLMKSFKELGKTFDLD